VAYAPIKPRPTAGALSFLGEPTLIPVLIVPILTRPELLQEMVASIDHPVRRLVVIDNGLVVIDNGDVVRDLQVPPVVESTYVVRLPGNLGVAGSWNLGIKATPMAPWWLVANFDVTWPAGSLAAFADLNPVNRLALSGGSPAWCAFAIGEQVIDQVGLFDEAMHPGYFEDDDMTRRCEANGITVERTGIPVNHRNSSTLTVDRYAQRNTVTFNENAAYYSDKVANDDLSEGRWTLARRRRLAWD